MPDDVYTTLLDFVSNTDDTDRRLKTTTENMKKMEEQAGKVSKVPIAPKISMDPFIQEMSKAFDEVSEQWKGMGIKISSEVASAYKTGVFSDAVLDELHELENAIISSTKSTASQAVVPIKGMNAAWVEALNKIHESEQLWKAPLREAAEKRRALEGPRVAPDPSTFSAFPGDELSRDVAVFNTAFEKTFEAANQKVTDLRTGTKVTAEAFRDFTKLSVDELEKISESFEGIQKSSEEELDAAIKASNVKNSLYTKEAAALSRQATIIQRNVQVLRNQAQQLQQISQVGLALGTGVVGGIFAFATKYVRDAKIATVTTVEWKKAQDDLAKSGQRIGAVFAQESLPLLKKATELARQAAGFVEKHPEIIHAALNAGLVVAGLSAVGLAVSKGIKLYADQLYLSSIPLQLEAGRLQFAAATAQLQAARLRAGETGMLFAPKEIQSVAGGAASLTGTLLSATAAIVIGVIVAKHAVDLVNLVLEKSGASKVIADAQKQIAETSRRPYPGYIPRNVSASSTNVGTNGSGGTVGGRGMGLRTTTSDSQLQEQALRAYENYTSEDLELIQKHYSDRQKIISDSLKAETKENEDYARNTTKVRTQLGKSISESTKSYEEQSRRAETENAQQRSQIIRDSGTEILRMEQDLQENLRGLLSGHEDKMADLSASRDALGLVKEQESYNRERGEEIRQANIEISRKREDLGIRLSDLQENFQQERDQRLSDYKVRLEELRASAAEQLNEMRIQHDAEIAEIQNNRAERVRELNTQFEEERKRRYNFFIAQIRDLDASLLGEKDLRDRRQKEMLVELDKFLLSYKTKTATLYTNTPAVTGRSAGGYAGYGLHLLGDAAGGGRGKREYILDGDLTELAERVLGGQLSQQKFASLLSSAGSGRGGSFTYNDSRRIDSRISDVDRQRIMDDTYEAITSSLFGG